MPNIKHYPQQKHEICQDVADRTHYLNIVYAIAILLTFQCVFTFSWYCYASEGYHHLVTEYEFLSQNLSIFACVINVIIIYHALFANTILCMIFLVLVQTIHVSLKLLDVHLNWEPFPDGCQLRHGCISEYDHINYLYNTSFVISSCVICSLSIMASFFFTKRVLIKTTGESELNLRSIVNRFTKEYIHRGQFVDGRKSGETVTNYLPEGSKMYAASQSYSGMSAEVSESADVTAKTVRSDHDIVAYSIPVDERNQINKNRNEGAERKKK